MCNGDDLPCWGNDIVIHIQKAERLVNDLLDAERLGLQATPEIRDRARECAGIKFREVKSDNRTSARDVDSMDQAREGGCPQCQRVPEASTATAEDS